MSRQTSANGRVWVSWQGDLDHDIRTPLTVIMGYLEMLRDHPDLLQNGQQEHILDAVWRNARHLHSVLERLLAMKEEVKRSPRFEIVDLAALLEERAAEWRRRIRRELMYFNATIIPPLPYVVGDPELIAQAVDALIENAVTLCRPFRPQGGDWSRIPPEIRLYAWFGPGRFREYVQILVVDEGEGLSEEDMRRFADVESDEMPRQKPLAVAKEIVRLHKGVTYARPRQGEAKRGHYILIGLPVPIPREARANGHGS